MRSFWLWIAGTLIVYTSWAQDFSHYSGAPPPENVVKPPVCNAGGYLQATCKNHHVAIGLSAAGSKNYHSVEWSTNHPSFTLSHATSLTPILKIRPGQHMCDGKVLVKLVVWDKNHDLHDSCDVEVGVTDFVKPTFTVNLADQTVECDDIPSAAFVAAKDDCDKTVDVRFNEREEKDHGETMIWREWVATDTCGNTNRMKQHVFVQDDDLPTLVGVDDDTTAACDNIPKPCAVVAYDNCDDSSEVEFEEKVLPGSCADSYTIVRTWSAMDNAYNQVTEDQTITVTDDEDPALVGVPVDAVYYCDEVPSVDDFAVTAIDNCDDDLTFKANERIIPSDCPHEFTIVMSWDATDDCGHTTHAETQIDIQARTPKVRGVEQTTVTIECDADMPICEPVVSDPCDYGIDVSYDDSDVVGTCVDEKTIYRTWTIENVCGFGETVTQTVHVEDKTPPYFTSSPPSNKVVECDKIPSYTLSASDNCDPDVLVVHPPETNTITEVYQTANYQIYRVWIATDNCGNTDVVHQTITVSDTTPPVIVGIPPDLTVECNLVPDGTADSVTVHYEDCDCPHDNVGYEEDRIDGTCPNYYRLIRTWTVQDCAGNQASGSQTIWVRDTTPPILKAYQGTSSIPIEELSTYPPYTGMECVDLCGTTTLVQEDTEKRPGSCSHDYKLITEWNCVDECGHRVSKSHTIHVFDHEKPVLVDVPPKYNSWNCDDPRLLDYATDPVLSGDVVTATDNSDGTGENYNPVRVLFKKQQKYGSCENHYFLHLQWTAVDDCLNKAQRKIKIEVTDYEPPVISKPQRKIITDDCNIPMPEVTATDNCDEVEVTLLETVDYSISNCPTQYNILREWTSTDECGNVAQPVKQLVEVVDNIAPEWITDPSPDTTVPCEWAYTEDWPAAVDPNCHDNYTQIDLIYSEVKIHVECEHQYQVARKWTASDCLGNFNFAFQTITVVDDEAPVFTYATSDETVNCFEPPVPNVGATDNCGYGAHIKYYEDTDYNCPKDFVIYRRWVATDDCGNANEQTQTITVQDTEVPVLIAPQDCVMSCDETPENDDATCTDDCSYVTLKYKSEKISGECPHNYLLIRSWHCEDECGKYVSHTQSIHVADLDPPVFDSYVPPFLTVECDDIPKAESTIGGSDNCGYPLIGVLEHLGGNPSYAGQAICEHTLHRNWIIKDTCGNTATYFQTITVQDTTNPVLYNVPGPVTMPCDSIHYFDNVYATDNCDPDITVGYDIYEVDEICEHTYTEKRVWTACDHCGNCVEGVQYVSIKDDEKPIFVDCQPSFHYTSTVVTLANIEATIPECVAWDNCDDNVQVLCTVEKEPGCTDDDYTLTRICKAFDDCGNGGYPVTQVFEIEDIEPCPFDNFPQDTTVDCELSVEDVYSAPTHDCAFMTMAESLVPQSCEDEAKIIKTFTVTDYCGNSLSQSQTITFEDNDAPTIEYLGDITEECELPLNGFLPVSDNCDYGPTQTYKEVQLEYTCAHNYVVEQQWFIKDRCENTKYSTRTVTIEDTIAPSVGDIPEDTTVDHQNIPGYPEYVSCDDNCPLAYTSATFEETTQGGTCKEEYTIFREWCCEDCFDKVCKTQTIHVEDNSPPVFAYCPPDETHHVITPEHPTLTCIDGYGTEVTPTFEQNSGYSDYTWALVIDRTWTCEDNCDNVETCNQKIYITVPPPILCVPDNMTLECVDVDQIPTAQQETLDIQDCSGDGMDITFIGQVKIPGTCDAEYCLVRTWEAVDNLKGSTKHAETYETKQTICVSDNYGPYWDFPAYRTVDCSKADELPDYLLLHPVEADDECGDATVTQCCWDSEGTYGYHWDYTATDECGHTISERMNIVVVDMEDPQLSHKPASMEVECTMDDLFVDEDPVTCTDNCGDPDLTTWSVVLEQACNHRKKVVRGWMCVDAKGNMVTHEQTISVVDNEGPEWDGDVPEDMTLECDEDLPAPSTLEATDNCAYVGYVSYLGETHDFPSKVSYGTEILTVVRKWIVYDECGLFAQHTQSIRIYDTTWPELIGVPEDNLDAECAACLCDSVTATDNCGAPSMHSWNVTEEGSCPKERTVITYWEAVDDVGHSTHASQTLIIRDSNPPEWKNLYTGDTTVDCHEVPPAPDNVQAIDECDPHITVEYKQDIVQSPYWVESQLFSIANTAKLQSQHSQTGVEYDLYRTWIATDSCGWSITKEQEIKVDDTTPPVFKMCPGDVTVPCTDIPDADRNLVVTDNCATGMYVRFKETPEAGTCDDEKTLYRHWWAFDTKDNRADCHQTITVIDNGVPEFTYVPPRKLYLECDEWSDDYPWPSDVYAVDDCSEATVSKGQTGGPGTCDQEGKYTRTWTATDECGNSKDFVQVIIVTDTQAPYCVDCPEKYQSVGCDEDGVTDGWSWKDECDENPTSDPTETPIAGTCDGESSAAWRIVATDECGNTATYDWTISKVDDTPPVISDLPDNDKFECEFPPDDYTVWKNSPTCEDDCSTETLTRAINVIEGTCPHEYKDIHTWTCTDDCGNFASESRTIEIYDDTPPRFTGKPTVETLECELAEPSFNVIADDNCGGVFGYTTPLKEEFPGTCAQSKLVVYTWAATDECGNTNSFDYTITWRDVDPPVISVFPEPNDQYECDNLWPVPPVTATDECDPNPTVHHWSDGEGSYDVSEYEVTHTWEVTDDCGNTDSKTVSYNVVDSDPPVITPTTNVGHGCKNIPAPVTVVCSDNCDPHVEVVYTEDKEPGTCDNDYELIRKWICTDNTGAAVTSEYTVTVADNEAPEWESTAPADTTLECDEVNTYALTHIATDYCDYDVHIDFGSSSTDDKCNNATSYTWTATDDCGHSVTDTWNILVQDTTKPTLSQYPPDVHLDCTALESYSYGVDISAYSEIWPGVITAEDNCEYDVSVKFTLEKINEECEQDYDLVMTWEATDDCGNKESHSMTAYISDKNAPVWDNVPEDYTVSAYAGYDNLVTSINAAEAVDECDPYVDITGIEQKLTRQYNRDCPNEWLIVRTLTATDDCGNSISHTYSISSIDDVAPELPDIGDITIECDEYDESYEECEVAAISPGDEDLEVTLSSNTVYLTDADCPELFKIYKVWSVTDCAGFTATTTQTVTVQDSTPPILSRSVDDTTVSCDCDDWPEAADLKAYDNCDEVTINFDETTNPGTCDQEYSIERTWWAEDSCGNRVEETQYIEIYDDEAPGFCDEDTWNYGDTFSCDAVPDATSVEPTPADECDEDPTVVLDHEWTDGDECAGTYAVHFRYVATDDCGNEAETTRDYYVQDDEPPSLIDDDRYCLYISYGSSWGSWASYNVDHLFRTEDNCDDVPELDYTTLICNATDDASYNPAPKNGGVGSGIVDCYFMKKAGVHYMYVKIDRVPNPGGQILGRTYHIYGAVSDDCDNEHYVSREVFIPLDDAIYQHVQPCGTGNPDYMASPPVQLGGNQIPIGGGQGGNING